MKNHFLKNISYSKLYRLLLVFFLFSSLACTKEKSDEVGSGEAYDPNKPIALETFYPDSGGIATKVIIKGSNFGTNPNDIKVYYGQKRAAVVKSIGNILYVITPKQPGDKSLISVVIGKETVSFKKPFRYTTQITVTTIAGKPGEDREMIDGTLSEANFNRPFFLCVDAEKNIFVSEREGHAVRLVNQEKNLVTTLVKGSGNVPTPNCPTADSEGKVIFVTLDNGSHGMVELNPETQWSPRRVKPRPKEGTPAFNLDWVFSMIPNPTDGLLYVCSYNGQLVRFNSRTKAGELIDTNLLRDSDGYMCFDAFDSNIIYIAYRNKHCIYKYNLRDKSFVLFAGRQNEKGYMDGEANEAKFNQPCQICCDQDGNLYIADSANHIIRKITRDGVVSTVIGIPGIKGYVDGSPEDALFNNPTGVAIDKDGAIYIGDTYNLCVRKLSIE